MGAAVLLHLGIAAAHPRPELGGIHRAEDIGVGERTLRRWANNQMDHKVIAAICEYFDVQPGDWLDYVSNSSGAE